MSNANEPDVVWTVLRLARMLERAQTELTLAQYRVLRMVGAGAASSAWVAEKLSVRRPTITAAADGLVASGHLVRESDAADRRVVRLCLTPSGRAALERADTALHARCAAVLGEVSDPDRLVALLGEVDAIMDARRAVRKAARA